MKSALEITGATARRFVLGKQGLWPRRRWAGKDGTRSAIAACEHLQLDPVQIVARSHDLMLHARVDGYAPEFFHELVYQDREFFDWGGWLAVRPMRELPYWRALMRRSRELPRLRALEEEHGSAIEEMRALLRTRDTVSVRDFKSVTRQAVRHYRGSKDSSVALYYLWRIGEAMTHHREGFERVYAAAESVAPAELLGEADLAETARFLFLKDVAFAGIGRIRPPVQGSVRTVGASEQKVLLDDLKHCAAVVPVSVEGWRGTQYMLGQDEPLLVEVARGGIPTEWAPPDAAATDEVTFLSPLDPVCARGRALELFGFDYVWEIYKRADKVRFGRYAMPILWGDRLVGRMDARTDRANGKLCINGLWLEEGLVPGGEFVGALRAGIQRLMAFLGTPALEGDCITEPSIRVSLEDFSTDMP